MRRSSLFSPKPAPKIDTAITDTPRNRPRYTEILNRVSADLSPQGAATAIEVLPFVRGRRPTDDARHPGLGSSDHAALVLGDEDVTNHAHVLYTLPERRDGMTVDVTLSLTGHDGTANPIELPGWHQRPVELQCFDAGGEGSLRAAQPADTRLVLTLDPETDLNPGRGERRPLWVRPPVPAATPRRTAPAHGGHAISTAETTLDVADVRCFGSLYGRVLERVVSPDVARQAAAAGVASPGNAYHPWFPVLLIGMDKASLYTRALVADIVHKQRRPGRTGVAVARRRLPRAADVPRDRRRGACRRRRPADAGGTFSLRERPLRAAPQPRRRRRAGVACGSFARSRFRNRASREPGRLAAEPVAQEAATLEFLHVHHDDLKRAIELAGPNRLNAQETWHRVFRDAERAVLRQTSAAFPELGYLPRPAREFVLWHRRARIDSRPTVRVPKVVAKLMLDQDGLYAAACNQYRASMNAVAEWATARSLMNPAGNECIPQQVSLLEAYMEHPERIPALQRRDGYGPAST